MRFESFGRRKERKKGNDDDDVDDGDAHTTPTLPPSFSFILSTSFSRADTHIHTTTYTSFLCFIFTSSL